MSHDYRKEKNLEYQTAIDDMLAEFPEYISAYNNDRSLTTQPRTRLAYLQDIRSFYRYVANRKNYDSINLVSLEDLNSFDVDFFNAYLSALTVTNERTSIHRKLVALRGLYKYLAKVKKVSNNAIFSVDMPKLPDKRVIAMDQAETEKFVDTIDIGVATQPGSQQDKYHNLQRTRDLAICMLILSSGIRVSECVGLNIDDVHLENCCLDIVRKGDKEGRVYFSDEAAEILADYLEERKYIDTEDDALFLSSRKQRIGVRAVQKLVRKYAQGAGISEHITVHKLRATFATAYYTATRDLQATSNALGHKKIETSQRYVKASEEILKENRNTVTLTRRH